MSRQIKNIGIIGKKEFIDRADFIKNLQKMLESCKCKLVYTSEVADKKFLEKCDLILTLGGDGTVLKVARTIAGLKRKPYMLGVHMGNVGFLAETTPEGVEQDLKNFIKGDCKRDRRRLLKVEIFRGTRSVFKSYALNDAVINQGPFARLLNLNIQVGDKLMSEFRGDGVIVGTTTGSTGHSLSAGGSIIHPRLRAFVITPMMSSSLSMRPIIIPDTRTIKIELAGRKPLQTEVRLTVDGQDSFQIQFGDRIVVKRTTESITFLRRRDTNFYSTLRHKLGWGLQ
ncbi:MAG: ATP-NAD kinase, NAD+ kinase [Candidatus Peregrinibacteria bacterium GW2011_GWF2_38_29]|nr:MAG: ATP-NAD kinase, NAD+ kinase [Candidatus Peregrinibacteria bacterium GW2011_GWF2_38_29]HBB02873.1 hypothetical protein [Candidatus Peregrinibacteria bacterium]